MKLALALLALAACSSDDTCDPQHEFCAHLSQYAFFDDIPAQTPALGVTPYRVNTPLFSDYATKLRFLVLPDGGAATWSDNDAFALPVGTMLVKTFSAGDRHLETRVLAHRDDGWRGASYIYNSANTDAELKIAGGTIALANNTYVVPNQNQCKNCHAEHDGVTTPIGPKARHLNREGQLEGLVAANQLVNAPAPTSWPRLPDAFDPDDGTLDQRARAWLDINCGHCHNATGAARTSGLFLDIHETDLAKLGVCKAPVATGRGSGGRLYGIVPGRPDESILVYRIESTEPEIKMPELGRNLVDAEGVALIRTWISALPGNCAQ